MQNPWMTITPVPMNGEVVGVDNWQPIATAPTDMTTILGFYPATWELPCSWEVVYLKRTGYVRQYNDEAIDAPTYWLQLSKPFE